MFATSCREARSRPGGAGSHRRHAAAVSALVLLAGLAGAARAEVAVGARAGTLGIGPEVVFGLSPQVHARLLGGIYSYDTTYDATGIEYDGTFELRNALLLLDWHPGGGGFRFSAGGGWNDNRLKVSAPLEEFARREIPNLPPLPAGLGELRGTARGDTLVPYVGLGWSRPFSGGRFGMSFDLGAVHLGEPEVDLGIDSPLLAGVPPAARQLLDAAAEEEERRLEAELSDYQYLPVVSFGFTFKL